MLFSFLNLFSYISGQNCEENVSEREDQLRQEIIENNRKEPCDNKTIQDQISEELLHTGNHEHTI